MPFFLNHEKLSMVSSVTLGESGVKARCFRCPWADYMAAPESSARSRVKGRDKGVEQRAVHGRPGGAE